MAAPTPGSLYGRLRRASRKWAGFVIRPQIGAAGLLWPQGSSGFGSTRYERSSNSRYVIGSIGEKSFSRMVTARRLIEFRASARLSEPCFELSQGRGLGLPLASVPLPGLSGGTPDPVSVLGSAGFVPGATPSPFRSACRSCPDKRRTRLVRFRGTPRAWESLPARACYRGWRNRSCRKPAGPMQKAAGRKFSPYPTPGMFRTSVRQQPFSPA